MKSLRTQLKEKLARLSTRIVEIQNEHRALDHNHLVSRRAGKHDQCRKDSNGMDALDKERAQVCRQIRALHKQLDELE